MRIGGKTYNLKLGLTIFLAITVISAVAIIYLSADKNTWSSLRKIRLQYGLLAGVLITTQWLFNGLRFQILLNSFEEKVSFQTSFKAFMANVFMSAMTPSQSGGGPLQIYILNRAGMPISKAFAGCLMGAVLTVTCTVLINLGILIFESNLRSSFGHHVRAIMSIVFTLFLLLSSLFLLSIFRINFIKLLFGKIMLFISYIIKAKRKYHTTKRLLRGLDQYSRCMKLFAGKRKLRILLAGILTAICLCINSLIAPILIEGLDIHQKFIQVFLIQFLIFFIAYFSPTPGGSGLTEFSNYWIMSSVNIDQNLLGVYTVIWRFFTSFLGVSAGAIIVLGLLKGKKKI